MLTRARWFGNQPSQMALLLSGHFGRHIAIYLEAEAGIDPSLAVSCIELG